MRARRNLLLMLMLAVGLGSGAALADHFDGDASTGTFNPQMTATITQTTVNRPTGLSLRFTQQDHEDPPVIAQLRSPGDWQFAFATTRQAETEAGVPTTRCRDAIANRRNSPNGTGTGTQLDYSKRTDAYFARAEKVGTARLQAHADGVSRPGIPILWTGDIAFISYDSINQKATLCALFITTDQRVTTLPDPSPSGGDDIEGITELEAEFPLQLVTDATGSHWETLIDLTDLIQDDTLQTLHTSVLELGSTINGTSAGNWHAGPVAFSKSPQASGVKRFSGLFKTCPASGAEWGNCLSGRPDVIRTFEFTMVLPPVTLTSPAGGALLNTNPVSVSGTGADPGASVQVFDSVAGAVGSPATADGTGNWTASVPLSDGAHTIHARTVDVNGQSPPSNSRTFTLDTTPPAAPVINAPAPNAVVGGTNVTFSGTAEPGSSIELVENLLTIGMVNAGPSGAWSTAITLAKGPHTVEVRATDIAGNTGAFSAPRVFDVTTAAPAVTTPTQNGATNSSNVTVTGTAEPGATVTLTKDGGPIGTPAIADAAGAWTIALNLPEGSHVLHATAVKDGFTSPVTVRTFDVDLTPPPAPSISSPVAGTTIKSISVPIAGTAEPRASVAVFDGPRRAVTATAAADGSWSAIAVLADGEHTIRAIATDVAGNVGPASADVTFIVDDPLGFTSPAPESFNPGSVRVAGTADPATSQVKIFEGPTLLATAVASGGEWSTTLTFASGRHVLTARSVTDGVTGPASAPHAFLVDADKPVVKITKPGGWLVAGTLIGESLRGTAADNRGSDSGIASIVVTYDNYLTRELTTKILCASDCGRTASWQDMPDVASGAYYVTVTATDAVGNAGFERLFFLIS